jgi:hypothetical protein
LEVAVKMWVVVIWMEERAGWGEGRGKMKEKRKQKVERAAAAEVVVFMAAGELVVMGGAGMRGPGTD